MIDRIQMMVAAGALCFGVVETHPPAKSAGRVGHPAGFAMFGWPPTSLRMTSPMLRMTEGMLQDDKSMLRGQISNDDSAA